MRIWPTKTRYRILASVALVLLIGGTIAWRHQSAIIGTGLEWYLERIATREEETGTSTKRLEVLSTIHSRLLMPPPADGTVAELFDFATLLSSRTARGEISLSWAAYLYTSYTRDLLRDRPDGRPRRPKQELRVILERQVEFFSLQKRPGVPGVRVRDLIGDGEDTISLEEIEAAEREGRELDLK